MRNALYAFVIVVSLIGFVLNYNGLMETAKPYLGRLAFLWPLLVDLFILTLEYGLFFGSMFNRGYTSWLQKVVIALSAYTMLIAVHHGLPAELPMCANTWESYKGWIDLVVGISVYVMPPVSQVIGMVALTKIVKAECVEADTIQQYQAITSVVNETVQTHRENDEVTPSDKVKERQQALINLINQGTTETNDQAEKLGVSPGTIRGDKRSLRECGLLDKTNQPVTPEKVVVRELEEDEQVGFAAVFDNKN